MSAIFLLADYTLFTWGPGGDGTRESPYWRWPGPPLFSPEVVRPSETISLMDGLTTRGTSRGEPVRHRGGACVAFLDGHARWLRFGDAHQAIDDGHGVYWLRYMTADR